MYLIIVDFINLKIGFRWQLALWQQYLNPKMLRINTGFINKT